VLNFFILLVTVLTAGILVYPKLANARLWRASITPLASIIGSGFLVLGPILDVSYGRYALAVMLTLCAVAYLFGACIRYNIASLDQMEKPRSGVELKLETLSSWALAFAYVISVTYYLNLFGAFGVSLTPVDDTFHARLLTSAVLLLILLVGWSRGFSALERMEQVSVGIKLAIISGLIFGLGVYFVQQAQHGALVLNPPTLSKWGGLTLMFGLIVTVQGFETSRYLGGSYSARTRIRSMRLAQLLSTAIYLIYIGFLSFAFPAGTLTLDETTIIDLMQIVAPILPILLVAAALSAQFSAAVADTSGSGGLIVELTKGRVSARQGYAILVGIGLIMTWTYDVFQIISHASRAFAFYYALQAAIAALTARRQKHTGKAILFTAAALLAALIVIFGRAVE
jgi:hypothetical protein